MVCSDFKDDFINLKKENICHLVSDLAVRKDEAGDFLSDIYHFGDNITVNVFGGGDCLYLEDTSIDLLNFMLFSIFMDQDCSGYCKEQVNDFVSSEEDERNY